MTYPLSKRRRLEPRCNNLMVESTNTKMASESVGELGAASASKCEKIINEWIGKLTHRTPSLGVANLPSRFCFSDPNEWHCRNFQGKCASRYHCRANIPASRRSGTAACVMWLVRSRTVVSSVTDVTVAISYRSRSDWINPPVRCNETVIKSL